ncbi:hypothetical protein XHC_4081 [Xanthomonas hortorum pv. carotae str. M081]|nr:hypothetical protein XHC_4081 [Xanthomonas hortorum pv. carotae str. M081]
MNFSPVQNALRDEKNLSMALMTRAGGQTVAPASPAMV